MTIHATMAGDKTPTQRDAAPACHRVSNFATVAAWAALLLLLSACAEANELTAEPLGSHQVHVGIPWAHDLRSFGGVEPVTWQLTEGPTGMGVVVRSTNRVVWTASVFDLGANQVGTARIAGPQYTVTIRVTDATGAKAQATGTVQAVPLTVAKTLLDQTLPAIVAASSACATDQSYRSRPASAAATWPCGGY